MTEKNVVEGDANTHFHRQHKYKYALSTYVWSYTVMTEKVLYDHLNNDL